MDLRALDVLGKHSISESYPQPRKHLFSVFEANLTISFYNKGRK